MGLQVGEVVDDRLLRQLLVTWLAPVDAAATQPQHGSAGIQLAAPQLTQQLPDLEAADLLPSLQKLPGIRIVKAVPTERTSVSVPGSCCRVRLHGPASDSTEPCAVDEPVPSRSPIEVCFSCLNLGLDRPCLAPSRLRPKPGHRVRLCWSTINTQPLAACQCRKSCTCTRPSGRHSTPLQTARGAWQLTGVAPASLRLLLSATASFVR